MSRVRFEGYISIAGPTWPAMPLADLPKLTPCGGRSGGLFSIPLPAFRAVVIVDCACRGITFPSYAEQYLDDATFRHVVEQADDCLLVVDRDHIHFINAAGVTLLGGTSAEEFLGNSPSTLFHPECRAFMTGSIAALLESQGSLPQTTQRMRTRDRRTISVDIATSAVWFGDSRLVRIRCSDASAQAESEAALAESEARLRELAENISDVFWSRDVVNNKILYASPNYEKMFGRQIDELLSEPDAYLRSIHPDDHAALKAAMARDPYRVELDYRIIRPDGSIRWVEVRSFPVIEPDGEPRRTVGIARDITSLRAAEHRVADSEAEYRLLFQHNPHAMWVYDTETYRFLAVNATALERYGWSEEEFLRMTLYDIRPPDELSALAGHLATFKDRARTPATWRHLTKDGRTLDVEVVSDAMVFGGREARLVLAHDVTERRKLEAQQLRAQRMESIGTLAGGIAHDLNNVLAPILMAVEMLKLAPHEDDDRQILDTIEGSARRGAELVRQILSFTRGVEGQRARVEPGKILHEIAKLARGTFDRHINVHFAIADDIWPILADSTQVHQAILNLAVNARDAMPAGGDLRFEVTNLTADAEDSHQHGIGEGRFVVITVTDTGTGIPAAVRDRIFDPFFTTKEVGKGTGLGLATVQAVVHSHRGRINLYSEEGKGTSFRMYLPAMDGSDPPPPPISLASLPRGAGQTILVVDDESAIRLMTRQTLEAFGYTVLTAEHGADAVALYTRHGATIALVLTDMMMPIMDGVATIAALRGINPDVLLVAASGLSANGKVAQAAGVGITDFLPKPYTVDELLRTIDRVLRRAPLLVA